MYSHQTAGPAYKLEKSIKRITEGDLTFEVSLRRNDNLKELAQALNELLKKFRNTLAQAKTLSIDLSGKLEGLEDDKKFKQLSENAKDLTKLINEFKIEAEKDQKPVDGIESEDEAEDEDEEAKESV
jgi:methyl-accepting chemotaxis protein